MASASGANVLYPSFRFNNRNYWLEYSTPPTTVFPEYDYEAEMRAKTTPKPGPHFINLNRNNNTVTRVPVGATEGFDCKIADLMGHQVSIAKDI